MRHRHIHPRHRPVAPLVSHLDIWGHFGHNKTTKIIYLWAFGTNQSIISSHCAWIICATKRHRNGIYCRDCTHTSIESYLNQPSHTQSDIGLLSQPVLNTIESGNTDMINGCECDTNTVTMRQIIWPMNSENGIEVCYWTKPWTLTMNGTTQFSLRIRPFPSN